MSMRLILGMMFAVTSATALAETESIGIGEQAGRLEFKDIRFLDRSVTEVKGDKGVVMVFLNVDCPIAQRYLPRLRELYDQYARQGIEFVGVYVDQATGVRDIASHALENSLPFAVVRDTNQQCTKRLGITRVPEVALLDADLRLVYRGRIDDQYRIGGAQPNVRRHDLVEAVDELLAGKEISVSETTVDGCLVTPWQPVDTSREVTFHEHVEAIMQNRCQKCHHDGSSAPFPLVSYDDVRSQGEMVAEVVDDQRMPPWYASPKHGHFRNDPSLTADERASVAAWVAKGMPQGDPAKAPAPLTFADTKWRIGDPDLVVTMTQEHQIQADGYVPYHYVMLPYVFKEDTYVQDIEILPHNKAVVHHCNMAYGQLFQGKFGRETFITGYVPGGQPMRLGSINSEVAYLIPKGSTLFLQIHYTTTGKEETSKISVGFNYAKGIVQKTTHFMVLDPRGFAITPGDAMFELEQARPISEDSILLGMFTHMHLRGRDMTFSAHYPDGNSETLLQIPNYNFEWQLGYECPMPPNQKKIPAGTKIQAVAHFDNSKFNPYNPDPSRAVPYGDQTYDEMFNGFVFWVHENEQLNLKIDPKTGHVIKDDSKVAAR